MSHVVGEGTKNTSPSQISVMLATQYEFLDDDTFPYMYFDRNYNHLTHINVDNYTYVNVNTYGHMSLEAGTLNWCSL